MKTRLIFALALALIGIIFAGCGSGVKQPGITDGGTGPIFYEPFTPSPSPTPTPPPSP